MAPPSKFSAEFREEAVQIALRSGKTTSEAARVLELELDPETLRGWVRKHQKQHEPAADAELTVKHGPPQETQRGIRETEMENAFVIHTEHQKVRIAA